MMKNTLCIAALLVGALAQADLPTESIGKIESLPKPWAEHWVLAHDSAFFHMASGRYVLLDPAQESGPLQYKGMLDASYIAALAQSPRHNELYVIETFYSRGTRGERNDVVSIYDPQTLAPIAEVRLPKEQLRMFSMPEKYSATIIAERFLVISNASPATGISVVDLDKRQVVESTLLPACILNFPTGKSAFSGLCVDGSLKTFTLSAEGKLQNTTSTGSFFSPQDNPLFEKPAIIDGIAYFIGFDGRVQEVDLSGEAAQLGETWSIFDRDDERQAAYQAGGWQFIAEDDNGLFYVIVHANGGEGQQENPGDRIWVYEAKTRKRVEEILLKNPAVSVSATRGKNPYLIVTTAEMQLDVYRDGKFVRTLAPFGQETPFLVHAGQL